MGKRQYAKAGGSAITILGLGLGLNLEAVKNNPICAAHHAICTSATGWISSILQDFGAAMLLLVVAVWGFYQIRNRIEDHRYGRGRFWLSTARADELPRLYEHYYDLFGTDLVPQETMRLWMQRNPDMVWKVMRERNDHSTEMVGFFDIEPLTASGRDKLHQQDASAANLTPEDIWSPRSVQRSRKIKRSKSPSAYYVGSIGTPLGASQWDRTAVVLCLLRKTYQLLATPGMEILTRPTTPEGLNLVKKRFHMTQAQQGPELGSIWAVHFNGDRTIPAEFKALESRLRLRNQLEL